MAGEKTEKATPKRRRDERKKGNVLLSREVVTLATLIATFYTLKNLAGGMMTNLQEMLSRFIGLCATTTEVDFKVIQKLMLDLFWTFGIIVLPILGATVLSAIIATMMQTRMLVAMERTKFKMSKLNPLNGIKAMFSLRSVVELVKSNLKIIVLGAVIYNILKDQMGLLPRLMDMTPQAILTTSGQLISEIVTMVAILFVALAAADYLYQWWEYEKNLRMSKQEVKDEFKQMEGDPQIKGKQRAIQQQRSRSRMLQAVPSADVVIRNPTHFAVALRYDKKIDRAPVVVAKGKNKLALRIVDIAEKNDVYVMENKPLARAMYAAIEVGQEIPGQFYEPVAQVLAFIYNLRKKDQNS